MDQVIHCPYPHGGPDNTLPIPTQWTRWYITHTHTVDQVILCLYPHSGPGDTLPIPTQWTKWCIARTHTVDQVMHCPYPHSGPGNTLSIPSQWVHIHCGLHRPYLYSEPVTHCPYPPWLNMDMMALAGNTVYTTASTLHTYNIEFRKQCSVLSLDIYIYIDYRERERERENSALFPEFSIQMHHAPVLPLIFSLRFCCRLCEPCLINDLHLFV